jgi:predicted metal-dependent phosphoesterase TrpH
MGGDLDLHLHTTASDGTLDPSELVRRAASKGLSVIAVSDHDTVAGVAEAQRAGAATDVTVIPAIELTLRVRSGTRGTVHVLGYGIDLEAPALAEVSRRNRVAKRAQVRGTLERLREAEGVDISWDEVVGERGEDAYVGRHHIAAILLRRGLSRTRRKAFRRYLRNERVPPVEVVSAAEGMAALQAAGGLAVLAHPTELDLKHHVNPLVALGLRGLEAYRSRLTPAHQERILRRAERHDLLLSGGSDWHGHYPEPSLGHWKPPRAALERFVDQLSP